MIKRILTVVAVGFIGGAISTGCMDSSGKKVEVAKEKVEDANRDLKAAQANYADEWQTFKRESEHKIKDNENSIDEFKERMEKSGSRLQAKYKSTVEELERKNHDLEERIEDYKDQGADRWEAFKSGFDRDMDKVEKAVKDLTAANG
jgi:exonuclease VII large subunit